MVSVTTAAIGLTLASHALPVRKYLVWNRTGSAPIGLYRLSGDQFTLGRWGAVSADSDAAKWSASRGYVGDGWPLLKRIAALPGAEICREDLDIFIDGKPVAKALSRDAQGRKMPEWHGCVVVQDDEIFLLNAHPRSLDGRYFGVTKVRDVDGVAVLVFLWPG
ncbi:S26 family signal peptidase [Henriciella aquimarina]|uniref:S26 family signal peptidase n=1 Tax=Henriciella aquimarina TaxID=545261 RepID=UPI0009FD166B|nr:S26 family signal peptidase [Henriciella aquimarina]